MKANCEETEKADRGRVIKVSQNLSAISSMQLNIKDTRHSRCASSKLRFFIKQEEEKHIWYKKK